MKTPSKETEYVTYNDHKATMAKQRQLQASEENNEMLTDEECAEQVASIREHVKNINQHDLPIKHIEEAQALTGHKTGYLMNRLAKQIYEDAQYNKEQDASKR